MKRTLVLLLLFLALVGGGILALTLSSGGNSKKIVLDDASGADGIEARIVHEWSVATGWDKALYNDLKEEVQMSRKAELITPSQEDQLLELNGARASLVIVPQAEKEFKKADCNRVVIAKCSEGIATLRKDGFSNADTKRVGACCSVYFQILKMIESDCASGFQVSGGQADWKNYHDYVTEQEEQGVIVKTVEKMTEQEAKKNRKYQFTIAFGIAIVILCLIAYALIRRRMAHQLQAAYEDLKYDYDRIEADTAVKEREASEFRIAQNIQRVIAPRLLPKYKSFDLWSAIKMGQMEGGGVMDYCVRDGKLFFCVGESGVEGVKASLLTTIVKAQFRTAATFESQPDKIMSAINNALAQKENKGIDIRLFIGVLDIYNGKLYFCNASHAAPLLVSNELHHLPVEQNVAIGEEPNYAYEAQEMTMLPGTMIFLNTEGLIKVKNAEHRVFNEKRMLGSALQAMKLDPRPKPFIENMLDAVHRFAGDFEQRDDMALLAIRFKGATKLEQKADEDLEPEMEPEVETTVAPEQPEPTIATEPIPEPQVFEEPKVYDEPEYYDEPDVIIEDAEATEIQ